MSNQNYSNFIYKKEYYNDNYIVDELNNLKFIENNEPYLGTVDNKKFDESFIQLSLNDNTIDASNNNKTLALLLFTINTNSDINLKDNNTLQVGCHIKSIFLQCSHYDFLHITPVNSNFEFTTRNIYNYVVTTFKDTPNSLIGENNFWIIPFLQLRNIYIASIVLFNSRPNILPILRNTTNIIASVDFEGDNNMYLLKKIMHFNYEFIININGNNITINLYKMFTLYYKYFIKVNIKYIQPFYKTNMFLNK